MHTVFISDLHLDYQSPESIQAFLTFLETETVTHAQELYILGDLFEFCVGDDHIEKYYPSVCEALLALKSDREIKTYFIAGNRDFTLGSRFEQLSGVQTLSDPSSITLYNKNIVLSHGDIYCVNDKAYQRFRTITHHKLIQSGFKQLPLNIRIWIGNLLRRQSRKHTRQLDLITADVTADKIKATLDDENVDMLIHGHTHLPSIELRYKENMTQQRIVLSDWHKSNNALVIKSDGCLRLIYNID